MNLLWKSHTLLKSETSHNIKTLTAMQNNNTIAILDILNML